MTRTNKLKARLAAGKRVFGTWSMLGAPSAVNAIAHSGLDFIIIDMEHGPMSFETVESQIYSTEIEGCSPIVRLGDSTESNILHALEIGAQSILVSHVSTPDEALKVVRSCKYSPEGDRGLSPFTRNHGYTDVDLAEKLKFANEQMFVGVLVEGAEGLDNLEKISATPGLDMLYMGIYDISQSLGVHGDVNNPKVVKVIQDCVKIIQSNGVIAGSVARDKDYMKLLIESGFRFISYRVDCAILRDGYENARSWFEEIDGEYGK